MITSGGDDDDEDDDYDEAARLSNATLAAEHAKHQERLKHLAPAFAESLPDETVAALPSSMSPSSPDGAAASPVAEPPKRLSRQWMAAQKKLRQQATAALDQFHELK